MKTNFSFDMQALDEGIHSRFPNHKEAPLIGLTGNFSDGNLTLAPGYYQSIIQAGGVPVIIPPYEDTNLLINTLEQLDGLLLTGGGDLNPLFLHEDPIRELHSINPYRDRQELLLTRLAANRQIPILGICRGMQVINAALGGTLYQDIYAQKDTPSIKHSQDLERSFPSHRVELAEGSLLARILNAKEVAVNSFHHQAVKEAAPGFRVSATAPDGVIEAIESTEYKSIIGVQWHPECFILNQDKCMMPLFGWLVREAGSFQKAKKQHERLLILDTHCDTPMFFPQGIKFDHRDSRILVDLHKMTDGHQDATTMVAYLPQPQIGESFSSKVAFDVQGPLQYADLIFDKIEEIVSKNRDYLSIARTPADLYSDKRKGRKSIMLGIENGLALEHDLSNVKYFAQRGVVYITLCHNGDNDICDSARGCNTHNGVSSFGAKVIQEMNRHGIMVDLSHAGEKSFYDALEISQTPIVCSHSSSRALCDVPRNLTDDQMRALAARGGVAHTTLYHGFLRKEGEADIMDAIAHLEHAIEVMGIDHVGLGTDFDGDGGIRGLADSSELINFTLQLLRRKYSEQDIAKIWGGNWLRVMTQVQNFKQ